MSGGSIYLRAPLRVDVRCETPAHDERLGLALSIARMRTGIVWMAADGTEHDEASVVVAYGGADWLERQCEGAVLLLSDDPGDEVAAIWRATQDHPHRLIGSSRADDCGHRDDLESPSVDALARSLAERVLATAGAGREVVQLPVLPGGAPFGIALSHDVDYLETTNRYRATRAFYLAQSLRRDDRARVLRHFADQAMTTGPWTHARDLREEREHGATSEWFVFARTPDNWRGLNARAYNPEYRLDASVVSLFRQIAGAGSVVGLHASPQAGSDLALLSSERDRLADIAGEITGVRHHMGRFRWPEALGGWLDAGFSYDSSFIINDAQGYRLGTAGPCLLLGQGRTLMELSPNWIDTASYNYEAETPARMRTELEALVERAALRRSIEGVVWHGIPLRGEGADSVYRSFLARAAALGGLVAAPRTFAEHGRALLDARLVSRGDGAELWVTDELARGASVVGAISYEVI